MHRPIKDYLESYLRDEKAPGLPSDFHAHLSDCADCRREVGLMKSQARLLAVLRPDKETEPAAGFYARVMERVETGRTLSAWTAFLEPVFMKRLVLACLVLVVVLAGYMVGTEPIETVAVSSPEFIIANDPAPQFAGLNPEHDRATMLVTLATYRD